MATFLDIHTVPGVRADDVAEAHRADLRVGPAYGVNYLRYWVDERSGKVFCLVDAPDEATASQVHLEAHGLVAEQIFRVEEGA